MPFDPMIVPRPQPGFQSSPVRATVEPGPRDGRPRPERRRAPVPASRGTPANPCTAAMSLPRGHISFNQSWDG